MIHGPAEEKHQSSSQWGNIQNGLAAAEIAWQVFLAVKVSAKQASVTVGQPWKGLMMQADQTA